MAEPKSLLDRIGGALKGAAEEKKAEVEAQVKPAVQAMPDRVEQQAQRVAEAADTKAAEINKAVADVTQKFEAQLADLRTRLAEKERELTDLRAKLAEKERELAAQRSDAAEKNVALVQKDRQIAELQAALKAAQAEAEALRAQAAPTARTVAAEAPARTYVVKPGDSLSAIAQAVYGNAARWPEIFEANKDKIKDPRLIRPGQELRIP